MQCNVNKYGKQKVIRISRQTFPVKIIIEQKQPENVDFGQ
jgi:hypothetical protein